MKTYFKTTQILSINGPKFELRNGDLITVSETLDADEYQDFLDFLRDPKDTAWAGKGGVEVIKYGKKIIEVVIESERMLIAYNDFLSEFEGAFNGF